MDAFLFVVKYAPFWAFPMMLISVFFAYIYWIKDIELIAYALSAIALFCALVTFLWVLAGGPDNSVKAIFTILETI